MKDSNKFILLIFITFSMVGYYYLQLLSNINIWILDIKSCFNGMFFVNFFLDHLHIFIYITLFIFLTFFLLYGLLKNTLFIYKTASFYLKLKRNSKNKKTVVIELDRPVAFNIFSKIILSKKLVQSLNFSELKAVLLHEKLHKKNKDFYRLFAVSLVLNFLPERLSSYLKDQFSLLIEYEVDRQITRKIKPDRYASILLKTYTIDTHIPQLGNYVKTRLESILYNRKILPDYRIFFFSIFSVLIATTLVHLLKTCFCGM